MPIAGKVRPSCVRQRASLLSSGIFTISLNTEAIFAAHNGGMRSSSTSTPTQSQLLAQYRAENEAKARKKIKKSYHNVIGIGIGGAGLAAMLAGLPDELSWGLMLLGPVTWIILKRV